MSIELVTRDIFLRHTGPDGATFVACHRVWDADRFIASQKAEAAREAGKAREKEQPARHAVEQITETQYKDERKKTR